MPQKLHILGQLAEGLLKQHKVTISMAYASYNNPVSERINGILKTELLRDGYPTHEEALAATARAIKIYNNERPHRSIDMLTPAEAHKRSGPLKKRWRNNNRRKNGKKVQKISTKRRHRKCGAMAGYNRSCAAKSPKSFTQNRIAETVSRDYTLTFSRLHFC